MPIKLSTLLGKVQELDLKENSETIEKFYLFMKNNDSSERHIVNNLKVILNFENFFEPSKKLKEIKRQDIDSFLDSKIKPSDIDPEKRWITTWNHYLNHLKFFYRWLYNAYNERNLDNKSFSDWVTPDFMKIRMKTTKRLSPYSHTDIWERDELLTIMKYEPSKRNKAALALFWDLDARNHEVTLLKIKNIRLREKYGEGEIPHEAKTGSGSLLLTLSFPYVRDWLNEHPFRNELDARLICNQITGGPIKSDAMWTMMKQLQKRITKLIESKEIKDMKEKEKLEFLLVTKKWNPYCLRHSAISADSDYLPEYALKKKVRWSINSKQGSRYIKKRWSNELKNKILEYNGIRTSGSVKMQESILNCPRCDLSNVPDNKYCSSCSYPLVPEAFDEIKRSEDEKIDRLRQEYDKNMLILKEEMNNRFTQILSMIQNNPLLARVKPEVLESRQSIS